MRIHISRAVFLQLVCVYLLGGHHWRKYLSWMESERGPSLRTSSRCRDCDREAS